MAKIGEVEINFNISLVDLEELFEEAGRQRIQKGAITPETLHSLKENLKYMELMSDLTEEEEAVREDMMINYISLINMRNPEASKQWLNKARHKHAIG